MTGNTSPLNLSYILILLDFILNLILQNFTALKHDIGCVLALVYAPVISLMEDAFYGIKKWINFMSKRIKLAAE